MRLARLAGIGALLSGAVMFLGSSGGVASASPVQSQAENNSNSLDVTELGSTVVSAASATGNLLINALNLNVDPSTITDVSDAHHAGTNIAGVITVDSGIGTLTVQTTGPSAGDYTYTLDDPVPFNGETDVFSYTLTDGSARTSSAELTITMDVSNEQTVTLDFSGALSQQYNAVSTTSGSLNIGTRSVSGTLDIAGLKGGTAVVKVNIAEVIGVWVGYVSVSDPGAHLNTTALVLDKTLPVSNSEVTGTAHGLNGLHVYTLNFTV